MCGIVGFWQRDRTAVNLHSLQTATQRLRHRGPDDAGYLLINTAQGRIEPCADSERNAGLNLPPLTTFAGEQFDFAFGFRRLAILDLSSAGHQPMQSQDGRYWIVYNGEVYNYLELRQELMGNGYTFRSGSDTEVILAAYQAWGAAALARFNGMWALAIWDTQNQTLFLARDRFGIKPLYYSDYNGQFSFGSEIKALVGAHGVPFQPNEKMVYRYLLANLLPNPQQAETFFANVSSLPPGHQLTITHNALQVARYWALPVEPRDNPVYTEAELIAAYRAHFTDAVRLRLRADVPIGTCLSGGLDSSAITATINQLLTSEGSNRVNFPTGQQQTFSAVYATAGRHNERVYIEKVLDHLPQVVGHFTFPTGAQLQTELQQFVWHQDEPVLSPSPFAQWCVMQKAHEAGITVLLDGQGADEALAGYRPFGVYLQQWLKPTQLGHLWAEMGVIGATTGLAKKSLLRQLFLAQLPDAQMRQFQQRGWQQGLAPRLLQPAFAAQWRDTLNEHFPYQRAATMNEHLHFNILVALPELLRYEDRNSMAHSIEARVPFLDYRLMEFTFQHAAALRIRQGWTKWILRKAAEQRLPDEIVWRKDKIGFETPQEEWFTTLLAGGAPWFADGARSGAYVDLAAVRHQLAALRKEHKPNRSLLWRLINLETWLQVWQN